MRLLAGNVDLLRQIAARFRGLQPRQLAPPDREQLRLRRLNWRLELELQAERASSDALSAALADSQRGTSRALERESAMAAKLERCRERCERQIEKMARAQQAELALLMQTNSTLRSEVRSLLSRPSPPHLPTPPHPNHLTHHPPHHTRVDQDEVARFNLL